MIPDINLLPSKERHRDKTSFFLLIILIIWAILLGVIVLQYFLTKTTNETIQSRVESLEMEKLALENAVGRQDTPDSAVNYVESVEFVEKLTAPTSKIIKELNELLPDKEYSYFTDYEYGASQVNIIIQFNSLDRVAEYVTRLNQSAIFNDVKVDEIDTFRIGEETSELEEEIESNVVYDEMPRYDVTFSLGINMSALLNDTGGEVDNE